MKKRTLHFVLIALTSLCLQACSATNELDRPQALLNTPRAQEPSTPTETAPWSAKYLNHCSDDVLPSQCPGEYGFQVLSDGSFKVGPGPDGQELTGFLEIEDFNRIQLMMQAEDGGRNNAIECRREKNSDDKNQNISSCNSEMNDVLKTLVDEYYPRNFPNPCIDADTTLKAFYDEVASCEADSDCGYLDDQYLPLDVTAELHRSVATDDCTFISPLIVANSFKAVSFQRELLLKRDSVRQVCGNQRKRSSCSRSRFPDLGRAAPRCIDGKCRLNVTQVNF